MIECGGFRRAPFDLIDLIGHDVNFAVTQSVFDAYHLDPRYRPSPMQKELVDAVWLGHEPAADSTIISHPQADQSRGPQQKSFHRF